MSFPRYDIVGSFLRPAALKEAREKFARGEISQAELTAVEDQEPGAKRSRCRLKGSF